MKITNEKRIFFLQIINTFFLLSILIIVFLFVVYYTVFLKYILLFTAILFSTYILYKIAGFPFFTYDSDGETINLINKNFNLFTTHYKEVKKAEFPKRKLISFKITNYIIKRKLNLIITSKRTESQKTKLSFDITYLSRKEVSDVKRSLHKIVSKNKYPAE